MCSVSYDVVVDSVIEFCDIPSFDQAVKLASSWRDLDPSFVVVVYCLSICNGITDYYQVF